MSPSFGPTIRPRDKRTLELLLHCRRQQLIRKAASREGALKIDDNHEWVCTSIISADINKVQGYFHIIPSGDKRIYGDAHLWNLHKDNKTVQGCGGLPVMGPDMGQLHELLAKASAKELETAMEINEPPKEELDHAEAYRSSEQEEQAKEDASEKVSPRKGKANHSQDAADRPDPREREPDDEEEH
jgi:hypothetical protein